MRFIHPVSTLSFAGIMPPDLSLEAPDLLRLYQVFKAQNISDTEQLDPTTFFSRDTFIRQRDVLRYEADIKNTLSRLVPHTIPLTRLLNCSKSFKNFRIRLSSRYLGHSSIPHRIVPRTCLVSFTCCLSCRQLRVLYALFYTPCSLHG